MRRKSIIVRILQVQAKILTVMVYVCICILFAIDHKNASIYIYIVLLKAVIIKNNYVCYVRCIATYTS